jgi:hypothetical protein
MIDQLSPGQSATLKPKVWWTAAQALSFIIRGVPLGVRNWDSQMRPKIERAQRKLRRAIGPGKVKAWGSPARHRLHEEIPAGPFRVSEPVLVVSPLGELTTLPPHKIVTYEGTRWTDIEFDADEIKQAFPQPLLSPQSPPASAMERMTEVAPVKAGEPANENYAKQPEEEAPPNEAGAPPAPQPPPEVAARSRPGRKPGRLSPQRAMCEMATNILNSDRRRPERRHGRGTAIARIIQKDKRFEMYTPKTIAAYIRDIVVAWEEHNPGK